MRRAPLLLPALIVIAVIALVRPDRHQGWRRDCPTEAHFALRLAETPQAAGRALRCTATVTAVDGHPSSGHIVLFFRADSLARTLRYGDRLLLHLHPDADRGSAYTTADHYIVIGHDTTSLRARSEALRLRLLARMQSGPLSARHAAVAAAFVLGWRGDIDTSLRSSFRDAGISHLLAVSGLHVGLLSTLIGWLMWWAGRQRRGRIVRGATQLVAIWAFIVVSGLVPSAVRAGLMFSLFVVADMVGRRTPKLNLLALSAIVTLLAAPRLLFDVGWQLSYAAVAGILLARPVIMAYTNRLYQSVMVSIAATTATLPITVATFHTLHPYFLVANVVVVPAAGLMLALSMVYLAVPCGLTAAPLEWVLAAVDWLTTTIAALPGATIHL